MLLLQLRRVLGSSVHGLAATAATANLRLLLPPPTSSGSRHPGALAVRMSPGGQDNTLECCIVRSAGPDRPGVIILECVQLHAVSGVAVGSPQQTRVQTSLSGSGTIDPIAAAYAHEVDAIVVLVACDVPSSFSLLQISIPPGLPQQESKASPGPLPHRVVLLPSIHPGASFFQLLPCGPVTNRNGTSPAECMAYVSYNQRPGASWGLVRARLSSNVSADVLSAGEVAAAARGGDEFEVIVSSGTALRGRVLGGGVAQRRPHFLSTIPNAAVFTVAQAQLLNVFSTTGAAALFTPNNMRKEPIPVRRAQFDATSVRWPEGAAGPTFSGGGAVPSSSTSSPSSISLATTRDVVEACAEKAHAAVDTLMRNGGHPGGTLPRSCFEDYDAMTVEAAVNVLSGHVLDQGPRLSHSFVGIDRGTRGGPISRHKVAHKLIGHRLADKRSWLDALGRIVGADSRSDVGDFQGVQDVLRRRSAQLEAAICLYDFEQQQQQHQQPESSQQHQQQQSGGLDIVSSARKEVVQGLRRLTPAALSSEGLSVADAFYGSVTKVAEVLPEIHRVLSTGPRDAALTLESVQACLAVVEPLMATTVAESARRRRHRARQRQQQQMPFLNAMLEASGHRAVYKILKHAVSVVQSMPREGQRGMQAARSLAMLEDLRKETARLVSLLLEDIRLSLRGVAEQGPETAAAAAAVAGAGQGHLSDGAGSLYTDTFIHIVIALLELGLAEEVQEIAEDHVHFETLFMVCRYMESTRGAAPAQQLMQSYLGNDRIRCDGRGKANFPHYVYRQYVR